MDFAKELSLWNKEIRTIIGNTPLYAHPYGTMCNEANKDLLLADGFKIFFINDRSTTIKKTNNYRNMCFRCFNICYYVWCICYW